MAKKLKSWLFRDAAAVKKEFHEHLMIVWDLSPSIQGKLLRHLPGIVQARIERETAILQQAAVKSVGGDAEKVLKAISLMRFFAAQWDPFRDSAAEVLEDIKNLGLLPKDSKKKESANKFLQKYFAFLEEDAQRRRKKVFAGSTLPSLQGFDAVIDHRVVVESDFDWQKDDPAKYKPSCSTTVPVIIVRIKRDEGDPLIFQCEPEDLEMLVRQFQATLKEYQKSKSLLK